MPPPGGPQARARDPFGLGAPAQQLPPRPRQPETSFAIDESAPESIQARSPARPAGDGGEAVLREALSKASREVIEKIAWEVVPQLAETIIREELDRLIREREAKN